MNIKQALYTVCLLLLIDVFVTPTYAKDATHFPKDQWLEILVFLFEPELGLDKEPRVPPPPPFESAEGKKEIEYVKVMTSSRTDEQTARYKDIEGDPFQTLCNLIGMNAQSFPFTQVMLYQGMNAVNRALYEEKWRYQRARPAQVIDDLDVIGSHWGTASYPADQAAQARMAALLLTDLFPTHDYVWSAWAEEVGRLNEVAGVQFPSDTRMAHQLAMDVYAEFKQSKIYADGMLEAEIELINFEPNIDALQEKWGPFEAPQSFP